jgi:hypothetical protein
MKRVVGGELEVGDFVGQMNGGRKMCRLRLLRGVLLHDATLIPGVDEGTRGMMVVWIVVGVVLLARVATWKEHLADDAALDSEVSLLQIQSCLDYHQLHLSTFLFHSQLWGYLPVFVVLIGVGRTVSTLVVLSTLEGETIGTVYCVFGVSGRVLSSESELLSSVILWEVSSWMDVVPSRLIPPLLSSSCEPLFWCPAGRCAQLGFLIRRFARGGHKLETVYVQSQSGFLQAVRAAVELIYVQKSGGNMLDKTEKAIPIV